MLTKNQIARFRRDGAILARNAVTPTQLTALRATFNGWVQESRAHDTPYGKICDGRPRFDLEDDHTANRPSLRRVASPTDISEIYAEVAFDSAQTSSRHKSGYALRFPRINRIRWDKPAHEADRIEALEPLVGK